MDTNSLQVFLPVLVTVIGTITGGLAWTAKHFVSQINAKDSQLEKSAEANKTLAVNATVAIQQQSDSNRELRSAVEAQTRALTELTRVVDELSVRLDGTTTRRRQS
jgi:hypothetical protein